MELDYKQMLAVTAGIVESARKNKGMSQIELAKELGVIQSTVCRVEKAQLSPTLYHWMKMCKILDIPEDAISVGYFDRARISKISSDSKEGGYPLPKPYVELRCVKVRWMLPILNFIKFELGEKIYLKMLDEMQMRPGFFVNIDNQVNVKFVDDFMEILSGYHKMDAKTQGKVMKYAGKSISHGVLAVSYLNANDQIDLVDRFLKNFNKYQRIFEIEVNKTEKNQIKFSAQVNKELLPTIEALGRERDAFLWDFFEHYLKRLSLFDFKNKNGVLKEVSVESSEPDQKFRRVVNISLT